MRDMDTLFAMEDVALLMQYLYLDDGHTVTVTNVAGVASRLRMGDDGRVYRQVLGLDVPEVEEAVSIPVWIGIIRQLKGQPPAGDPVPGGAVSDRWTEIEALARADLALDRMVWKARVSP